MVVKYSKIFACTNAIYGEPVTILVEYIETEGFRGISVESLEGEYASPEEFRKESKRTRSDKIYSLLPLMLHDTRQLVEALNEALKESQARTN